MPQLKNAHPGARLRHRLLAAGATAVLAPVPALAASFVVTTVADALPAPAGSLREALNQANATAGPHTITFQASGTVALAGDLPFISQSVTIDGTGKRITIDAQGLYRIFSVQSRKDLVLRGLNLTGANCISGSLPTSSASATCRAGGSASLGAAVLTDGGLIVENSTIAGNRGDAGIVYVYASFGDSTKPVAFVNSTVTGNHSGGLAPIVLLERQAQMVNSTVADNVNGRPAFGNVVALAFGSGLRLANSILSSSGGPNCSVDAGSSVVDAGGNLSSDASCGFTQSSSVQNTLPQLNALADNGGDTPTMKPATGSPAIDQGVNALAVAAPGTTALATDQRGKPRIAPTDGRVDRGAVEVTPPPTCTAAASPATLWSPNHKLVDVALAVSPSSGATWSLRSVTSSEADSGLGKDDLPVDIQGWASGTADAAGKLRAERYAVDGRRYTFTVDVRDSDGGIGTCQARVQVLASQKR